MQRAKIQRILTEVYIAVAIILAVWLVSTMLFKTCRGSTGVDAAASQIQDAETAEDGDYSFRRLDGSAFEIRWHGHIYLCYGGAGIVHAAHCPCRKNEPKAGPKPESPQNKR